MIIATLTTEEIRERDLEIEMLLGCLSRGEKSALRDLYALIRTDVFAYALSKTGNKQDADDVVQDTFVHIYKYAKQYKPLGKPLAWIFTIEHNLIRRQFQLRKRTVEFEESFVDVADSRDTEERIVENEFLRTLLQTLNEEERELISLHIVSGMKHREIAKLLGKPLSTVLSKYNRAIKKLQNTIKEEK